MSVYVDPWEYELPTLTDGDSDKQNNSCPPAFESLGLTIRRELRYHVAYKVHGLKRTKSFSNLRSASRFVAVWELRKIILPHVSASESQDVKAVWLEAYGKVFPADEECPCCQRDYFEERDGYGVLYCSGYDSLAVFCKTKRKEYLKLLADQIVRDWTTKDDVANA